MFSLAAVCLLPHLRRPGQDQIKLRGRLALLDNVGARRVPADLDVVADVAEGDGLSSQHQEGVGKRSRSPANRFGWLTSHSARRSMSSTSAAGKLR